MAITYLYSCNRIMECSHLILIELSFYNKYIYIYVCVSKDNGNIINFINQVLEYFLELKSKLLHLYLFFSYLEKENNFYFPNTIVTFPFKKIERKNPPSAVFLRCSLFWDWALVGKLITFCGFSRWQLQSQNTDVCLRCWESEFGKLNGMQGNKISF